MRLDIIGVTWQHSNCRKLIRFSFAANCCCMLLLHVFDVLLRNSVKHCETQTEMLLSAPRTTLSRQAMVTCDGASIKGGSKLREHLVTKVRRNMAMTNTSGLRNIVCIYMYICVNKDVTIWMIILSKWWTSLTSRLFAVTSYGFIATCSVSIPALLEEWWNWAG